jgi:hypothetical protein
MDFVNHLQLIIIVDVMEDLKQEIIERYLELLIQLELGYEINYNWVLNNIHRVNITQHPTPDITPNIQPLEIEIVQVLPSQNQSNRKIYLIANNSSDINNDYDEYIWVNNKWENIGDKVTDITNSEIDNIIV